MITKGREGKKGSWCVECGVKVFEVEQRRCSDCKHFEDTGIYTVCGKNLIGITPSMHVVYAITVGTCFEPVEIKE